MQWFTKKRIYLDYASAPPVAPEALRAMRDAEAYVGNPGALHEEGVSGKRSLEESRGQIARLLGVKARELIFTSGLTEANNLAIVGYARSLERIKKTLTGTHWLVSSIEHASVLECFSEVERMGGTISYIEPDARGIITPASVARMLRPETVFVSVGWANNELGTIAPLSDIARTLRTHEKKYGTEIILHSDAGQAPLYSATSVHSLGVDLLSLGANKLYGPHGIGCLYAANRVKLAPVIHGGKQERGLRAGTESVALAAGFAAALARSVGERESEAARLKKMRDQLARELSARISGLTVNGSVEHALPHMLNVSIPEVSTEYLTLALDREGIAVSTKSACREGEESRSHAVEALVAASERPDEDWRARNTLRFSLGRDIDARDIGRVAKTLEALVANFR